MMYNSHKTRLAALQYNMNATNNQCEGFNPAREALGRKKRWEEYVRQTAERAREEQARRNRAVYMRTASFFSSKDNTASTLVESRNKVPEGKRLVDC